MSEATTATVDTQDNTNVSTEQEQQTTEEETPMFDTSKDDQTPDTEEDKPFIDTEEDTTEDTTETPEDYGEFDLSKGEEIKYTMSEDEYKSFTDLCKKGKISKELAQEFIDFDIKRNLAQEQQFVEQKKQALKEDTESIRKKYGEEFDKAKVFFDKAYKTFMPEKLRKIFIDAGFDRNPELFDMMVNIGKQIGEDTFVKGETKVADPESFGKYSELLPQNPRLGKLK